MKLLNTEVTPFTAAYFADAAAKLFDGDVIYFDGDEMLKGEYHITLDDDRISFKSLNDQVEPFEYTLRFTAGDERTVLYRGVELDGKKYFALWMAPYGEAHGFLRKFRDALWRIEQNELDELRLEVTDAAILSGFVVKDHEEFVQLVQLPTWKTGNDQIVGRTPYVIDDLHSKGEQELFFNNLWLTFPKLCSKFDVFWNEAKHELVIRSQRVYPADYQYRSLNLALPAMEEVNYNGPAMVKLGLGKPEVRPEEIFMGHGGRGVAYLNESFNGVEYDTYVLSHGEETELMDQLTLGAKAIWNEQLIAVLKHRYTKLQEELPHEANVRTLELLDEIIAVQAARYQQREQAGVIGTMEQVSDDSEVTGDGVAIADSTAE